MNNLRKRQGQAVYTALSKCKFLRATAIITNKLYMPHLLPAACSWVCGTSLQLNAPAKPAWAANSSMLHAALAFDVA